LIQPAVLGGAFIGILSALPIINLGNCCCLWIAGGGALAAHLDSPSAPRRDAGRGAIVGLLAGVIGAFIWLFAYGFVETLMAPVRESVLSGVLSGSSDMPAEVREAFEMMSGPGGSTIGYVIGFSFQLFAGMIFSTLGGALVGFFAARQDQPIPPQH
jgi:hypothetical protein